MTAGYQREANITVLNAMYILSDAKMDIILTQICN